MASAVTKQQAEQIAVAAVPGGTVSNSEEQQRDGKTVWHVHIRDTRGYDYDVDVDAATNFLAFAALLLIFAAGLHRGIAATRFGWAGPVLLGAAAVGLVLAAVFPLREDATGNAYDPGNHVIAGVTFFSCSALALLVLSRRFAADPRWRGLARYVGVAGVAGLGCFVMLGRFAMPEGAPLHDVAGLLQRFTLLAVTFPALLTVALRLRRLVRRPTLRAS
ncbi:MAG: DUF998 domain-containing protein [Rhodococcus sp. (in: high G+C Gram-positive bacteria)]|nr:MAG: DUF998 domain-containing protein [Rhodococcus sp. (in: high G+C Gram-positive bacteria)]